MARTGQDKVAGWVVGVMLGPIWVLIAYPGLPDRSALKPVSRG